ncbi:MAG TPA: serine hydrolase [Nitrososphaera sp.]|nr:serine hydrolase [Nitrososphaera sp.]
MKKLTLLILIATLASGFPFSSRSYEAIHGPAGSFRTSGEYTRKLRIYEEFVRQQMELEHIPGLTIGFVKDGYMWVKGFGYADLENKVPATSQSSYRLASITKSMTAVAILQLVEKGKIKLDAEVQTYVPYFPKKKWPITIRHLLLHLSGLRHNSEAEKIITRHLTTKEAVAQYADSELLFEPGARFSYSTPGYVLLGAVIEGVTNQSYADYMRQNIWEPLEMKDTRMDDPAEIIPGRVRGYRLSEGKVKNSQAVDVSNRFAGGGIRTTVVDMLKFASGLNAGKLLSKESLDLMYSSGVTRDGRLTDAGMSWFLSSLNGRFTLENNGGQQETRTELLNFPRANLTIALAMNFEFNDYLPLVQRLYQLLLDEQWSGYSDKIVVTGDKTSDALIVAMQNVFFYGSSYNDQHRKAASQNPQELTDAFAYFNQQTRREVVSSGLKESLDRFEDALNPRTGQPFIKMGSFMAEKLNQPSSLQGPRNYHQSGAIKFFADYVTMYERDPAFPANLRFSPSFENQIKKWAQAWDRTDDSYVRQLWITPYSNLDQISARLRKTFSGAEIYPNLNRNINAVTWQLILKGNRQQAAKLAELSVDLYPQSDLSHALLGVVKMMFRDRESARAQLRQGAEIRGWAPVFSRALNSYARALADNDRVEDALELLLLTIDLYPKDATLYESVGELYSKAGNKVKAIEFYKKALALDPKLERSKQMLEKFEQRP